MCFPDYTKSLPRKYLLRFFKKYQGNHLKFKEIFTMIIKSIPRVCVSIEKTHIRLDTCDICLECGRTKQAQPYFCENVFYFCHASAKNPFTSLLPRGELAKKEG